MDSGHQPERISSKPGLPPHVSMAGQERGPIGFAVLPRRFFGPFGGRDLTAVPLSLPQIQIAEFGHIDREHIDPRPARADVLGAGAPIHVPHSQRQSFIVVLPSAPAGGPLDNRHQVSRAIAIIETPAEFLPHRQIEHEPGPAGALEHLNGGQIVRKPPIQPVVVNKSRILRSCLRHRGRRVSTPQFPVRRCPSHEYKRNLR